MNGLPSHVRWVLGLTLGAWLLVVPAASAYIDPGSTSMVFQALIAFAMAAGLTLKMFWRRLRRLLKRGDEDAERTDVGV